MTYRSVTVCLAMLVPEDTLLCQITIVRSSNDVTVLFQEKIDAVYKWSIEWRMPFSEKKCQAISFEKPVPSIHEYTLGSTTLDWTDSVKYLGVTIQSDLKFDTNIEENGTKSKKILVFIKHLMYKCLKGVQATCVHKFGQTNTGVSRCGLGSTY